MSPVISSDVSDDMAEEIEDVREEGESRSATVKRLLRAGLDAEESPDGVLITYPAGISLMGWFLIAGAFLQASASVGYLGVALLVAGFVYGVAERQEWL